jgi:hypothetical protein
MREFIYGLILGSAAIYLFNYFDAPGILDYLNDATASAVKSTSGYSQGSPNKKK